MSKKILLDSCVVSRMFLGQVAEHTHVRSPSEEQRIEKLKVLYNEFCCNNDELYISTIVLAEVLQGIEEKNHEIVENNLNRYVNIINFCSKSARECALIFREKYKNIERNQDSKNLKADIKILANAVANHMDEIYTFDKDFAKIDGTKVKINLL
jgi:predicted nucleic acid-binding protein